MSDGAAKTLWIHIGMPKTGSTAIQGFLKRNREALLADGVRHMASGLLRDRHAHHNLSRAFTQPEKKIGFEHWDDLNAEFAASASADNVISSEGFSAVDPKKIARLLSAEAKAAAKVVLYIRRQDLLLEALYKQHAKLGKKRPPRLEHFLRLRAPKCDFWRVVRRWRAAFGEDRVVVRIYDRAELVGGDVREDFLSVLGRARGPEFAFPDEVNPTPSAALAETMVELGAADVGVRVGAVFKDAVKRNDARGARDLLSRAQRAQLLRRFADGNERLRASCFPDRPRLFDESDLADAADPEPFPDELRPVLRAVFQALAAQRAG